MINSEQWKSTHTNNKINWTLKIITKKTRKKKFHIVLNRTNIFFFDIFIPHISPTPHIHIFTKMKMRVHSNRKKNPEWKVE